jgi:predicted ATPase
VRNYRLLKDVVIGRVSGRMAAEPLTPLTAVIGRNGTGKSTLFDAFGFLQDCLDRGVENACNQEHRGGFDRILSGANAPPISFELCYRDGDEARPLSYEVAIDLDDSGRPFVARESLRQRRSQPNSNEWLSVFQVSQGNGFVTTQDENASGSDKQPIGLTDTRQLGLSTLGTLNQFPRISCLRDFLKAWYLSDFTPSAARGLPAAGPQKHLNASGDNLGNVVQFMQYEQKDRFRSILNRIAERIPGIKAIDAHVTEDGRILLRFNDGSFKDPFFAQQMSDGTLKVFTYLLLLEDPDPPPFICIEEPENGLYHKLLEALAHEFRTHATAQGNAPQILVTTHQPYFVDALAPEEVWLLEKGDDGYSTIRRASDLPVVRNLVTEGLPLGSLWYSDYLDQA